MALYDTFLIDGVDIAGYARIVEDWEGARVAGARRGSNVVVPGRDGELFAPKRRDTPTLALGLAILSVDPATGAEADTEQMRVAWQNQNFRDLARLVNSRLDRPVTVTRRIAYPTGLEEHNALAELAQPFKPTMFAAAAARAVLELRIIDGVWLGTTLRTGSAAGATDVLNDTGDTETNAITLTFSAAGSLINATAGCAITVDRPCTVEVPDMFASDNAIISGRMVFYPGENALTATAGTVDIEWREAYL